MRCAFNEFGALRAEAETLTLMQLCQSSVLDAATGGGGDDADDSSGGGDGGAATDYNGGVGGAGGGSGSGGGGGGGVGGGAATSARSAFKRLQQICFLLNLERATDVFDTNYM
jgi:hypothetical protein